MEKDMSEKLGKFNPFQLVYFGNLTFIDISTMTFINPQHFIESVMACNKLKELHFRKCIQFHECQIVKMLCGLKFLEIVDGTETREMQYINAYIIITTLKKLRVIVLEPKLKSSETRSSKWLVRNFNHIIFGNSVMKMLQ